MGKRISKPHSKQETSDKPFTEHGNSIFLEVVLTLDCMRGSDMTLCWGVFLKDH